MTGLMSDELEYFVLLNSTYVIRQVGYSQPCQKYFKKPHVGKPLTTHQQLISAIARNSMQSNDPISDKLFGADVSPLATYYFSNNSGNIYKTFSGIDFDKIVRGTRPSNLTGFKGTKSYIPVYPASFNKTIGFKSEGLAELGYEQSCGHFDIILHNKNR